MSAVNLCLARCRGGGGGGKRRRSIGEAVSELPGYPGLELPLGGGGDKGIDFQALPSPPPHLFLHSYMK